MSKICLNLVWPIKYDLGAPERTLNRWLVLLAQNKTWVRKKEGSKVAKKATPNVIKAIKKHFNHKTGRISKKVC